MLNSDTSSIKFILASCEKILYWLMIIMAVFNSLWTLLQFVIWDKPYLKLQKWGGLAIIMLIAAYLAFSLLTDRDSRSRIGEWLKKIRSPELIFLTGLFIWYIVVCLIRSRIDGKSYFASNDNRLFFVALSTFVYFPFTAIIGKEKAKKAVDSLFNLALAAYTPVCAWVIWKYYHLELVTFPSGNVVELYKGNSLTMGSNRNITAAYAVILFGICIYMAMTTLNKIRIVYIAAALVHLVVIFLSNSRTSFLVIAVMMSCYAVMLGRKYLKKRITVVIGVLLIILASIALLYVLRYRVLETNADLWREKLDNPDAMSVRKFDGFAGRISIWKGAVKIMLSSPDRFFLGITPTNVAGALNQVVNSKKTFPHCHNLFLNIGVSFGVPAMILFIWFTGSIVRKAIRLMKYKADELPANIWTVSVIVFGILLIEMLEVLSFGNRYFNGPVLYILAGWIVEMNKSHGVETVWTIKNS